MSASVLPIADRSEEDQAWEAYLALCDAEKAEPALSRDRAHVESRVAAHVRFCELFARQCRRENVVQMGERA